MLRSARAETRNKAKEELRRVINSIDRVRKWEKRWVVVKDTSMRVYKWVPTSSTTPSTRRTKEIVVEATPALARAKASSMDESNENSREAFSATTDRQQSTTMTAAAAPTDFSHMIEDSNTAFSENLDSDSNMGGLSRDGFYEAGAEGESSTATDFSAINAAAAARATREQSQSRSNGSKQ